MKDFFLSYGGEALLKLALPVLMSFLIVPSMDALKKASKWIDGQKGPIKDGIVFVMAALSTMLATAMGTEIPTDISQWSEALVKSILTFAVAIAMKRKQQIESLKVRAAAVSPIAQPSVAEWRDNPMKVD